jgi:hypothetical protein
MINAGSAPVPFYRTFLGALTGIPLAVVYGILTRWIFGIDNNDLLIVMTMAFILFVPLALGALTVWAAPRPLLQSWPYAVFMPWLTSLVTVGVIWLMRLEELVCIVLALPLFLPLSSLGGIVVRWLRQRGSTTRISPLLGIVLLGPYLLAPVEMQLPAPEAIRTVENSIVIAANPEAVWANITSVAPIQPHEQRWSPFHPLGLPKPLKADMVHPGPNAVRYGYFEEGLIFIEEIIDWQENEYLAFTIDRDPSAVMPTILQQIDGAYFGVVDGFYRIEPLGDGSVRLYLSSRHRLTTHFNQYAGLWTDAVMSDLQQDILEIVRKRSEATP